MDSPVSSTSASSPPVSPASSSQLVDVSVASSVLERALVLDFGSQYSHLIVRRLRECHVYSELKRCDIELEEIEEYDPTVIVLSGGPSSVYEEGAPHVCEGFWDWRVGKGRDGSKGVVPVLGICYGMQEMVHAMGGQVEAGTDKREYGHATMKLKPGKSDPILAGVLPCDNATSRVWMSHGDRITRLPSSFEVVAETDSSYAAVMAAPSERLWGLQFHPEVTHTARGTLMLENFVKVIGGMKGGWNMHLFEEKEVERLRSVIGPTHHVIGAVSGGVDSTVAAALLHKAVGDRFHAFTIDTGLLRKNEGQEVLGRLKTHIPGLNLSVVDASTRFLAALKGVKEPEMKRKICGAKFIEEFELAFDRLKTSLQSMDETFLLQGTLYPDVIESTSFKGPSHTIKTHHNVGGLPAHMKMKVLEPLRELFKDEVRALGEELGIPRSSVWRHPFPGPGLAIRILSDVTEERANLLREADDIFLQELRATGHYDRIGQAFVVLLPEAKSVGVMGDCRTYEMTAVLRAVTTTDFMTADWYRLDYDVIAKISNRIINEVKGINRVCYDVSSKPPSTIEWE